MSPISHEEVIASTAGIRLALCPGGIISFQIPAPQVQKMAAIFAGLQNHVVETRYEKYMSECKAVDKFSFIQKGKVLISFEIKDTTLDVREQVRMILDGGKNLATSWVGSDVFHIRIA
jgi:hypothetical protein